MNVQLDDSEASDENEQTCTRKEEYEYIALNPFKEIYKESPLMKMAFEFGPSCIPLNCVGMILNYAGNHLLQYIHVVLRKKIFYPLHKVISI